MLFSAASVAFNILHAVDQALARAGWVAALVFAMPPVALVLATHLLLQQGAWRRQPSSSATAGEPPAGGTAQLPPDSSPTVLERPATASQPLPAPTTDGQPLAGPSQEPPPADAATRERARQLYAESRAAGRKLTGAELGRALGTSDSYGRLLLREFRASRTTSENGASKEA